MNSDISLPVIFGGIGFFGLICIMFQIYRIIAIDAKSRGLKHPRYWALFAMSGDNSSGLFAYLFTRKRYPVIDMNKKSLRELRRRKRLIVVGFILIIIGVIGFIKVIPPR